MAWWLNADWVIRAIFMILIALSVIGWTIIVYKFGQLNRLLGRERRLRITLEQGGKVQAATALLGGIVAMNPGVSHQEARVGQAVREKRVDLESGLTFLASIGVSTPFIGLLGTVWGIMHALAGLGQNAALSLDLVAGPVAEALVATAVGLFAAIPAAVGYNMLIRRLRRLMTLAEGNLLRLLAYDEERNP
ncbi:MAG: MotA/TolQ/ExbB proton channel family protein [Magnetococcales bacterium]|nr:MotA/TolQ/ExbB proton channel family protein [Magnetococcales bacterium]MBF0437639.1 MotA/TolQ/ExbB proton channel family protein [Magnetococcales bacterium]